MERAVQASEPGDRSPRRIVSHADAAAPPTGRPTGPATPIAAIELARARLARELRSLPPWGSAALLKRLLAPPTPTPQKALGARSGDVADGPAAAPPQSVSTGALVHCIRRAQRVSAIDLAADLFVALLGRIEGMSRQWARRAVASAPVDLADASAVREDLRQELTLRLWERIGRGDGEAWELFFQRALIFEQRHVAKTFMARHGYWRDPLSQAPSRGVAILLSRLTGTLTGDAPEGQAGDLPSLVGFGRRDDDGTTALVEIADGRDAFTAADLADLRRLVARLPDRERQAILLRFWYGATEAEISEALGGVTTRTVRNTLTRAYAQLRGAYQPDHAAHVNEGHDPPTEDTR